MSKVSPEDLLTPAQAARLLNVSREWVRRLMRADRLKPVDIAGRPFVRYQDVMNYRPGPKTGRPPKPKAEKASKKGKGKQ